MKLSMTLDTGSGRSVSSLAEAIKERSHVIHSAFLKQGAHFILGHVIN